MNEPQLSGLLQHYNMVFSPGIKEKQLGRASGGLLIFIKKEIQYEVLDISYLWIIIKIKTPSLSFILGNLYINPKYDMEKAIELLADVLDSIHADEDDYVILGGDFNGRIADGNYLEESVAQEIGFLSHRISLDLTSNSRGDCLVEFMESRGLLALNGRTEGDIPGQFTFLGNLGKSVVDLV